MQSGRNVERWETLVKWELGDVVHRPNIPTDDNR